MPSQRQGRHRISNDFRQSFVLVTACFIISVADADVRTASCVDDPKNWIEKYSPANCQYYADREWCTPTGKYGRSVRDSVVLLLLLYCFIVYFFLGLLVSSLLFQSFCLLPACCLLPPLLPGLLHLVSLATARQ